MCISIILSIDLSIIMSPLIYVVIEEEFDDTKGIIRICKSKKNREHNGQKKKDKRTNNDLQNV